VVVALDRLLGVGAVDEVIALVGGDATRERCAQAHVDRSRMLAERGEGGRREDHARLPGRLGDDGAPELGQLVAEPEFLQGGRCGRTARHRHAERERAEPTAETLLDLLELVDVEVRLELVGEERQRPPVEQRDAG